MSPNTSKFRLFPRYDISKLPFDVEIAYEKNRIKRDLIDLLDISISGVRLKSRANLELPKDNITLYIRSDNFNFEIPSQSVWMANYPDGTTHYGLRFMFSTLKNLNGWLGFIKALHYLSLKSSFEQPDPSSRYD